MAKSQSKLSSKVLFLFVGAHVDYRYLEHECKAGARECTYYCMYRGNFDTWDEPGRSVTAKITGLVHCTGI